jgi:cytochrome c oxidase cbb3-type subunit III
MDRYFPSYLRVTFFFFLIFGLIEFLIDSGDQPAFVRYPITILFLAVILLALIAIEAVISATASITRMLMTPEQREAADLAVAKPLEFKWLKRIYQNLVGSQPIEKEKELLLDHDYDGIKELDNNLPPWWLYLFYGCIVFGVIYLLHYEVMGGQSQEEEFQTEMAMARVAVEEYKKNAPDLMDEKTVTLLTDAGDLAKGKALYETNCAACHKADGGGQIGPNLTDEYWILGGGIKKIFSVVSNGGRDGKGMVAWKGTLKPREIQSVSSYIISLQGSAPKEAKAAEGEILWKGDTPDEPAAAPAQ